MPLALQMSLHLSSEDTPEYFGTHTTEGAMRLLLKFRPLLSHCSSRNVLPVRGEGVGGCSERWECRREIKKKKQPGGTQLSGFVGSYLRRGSGSGCRSGI